MGTPAFACPATCCACACVIVVPVEPSGSVTSEASNRFFASPAMMPTPMEAPAATTAPPAKTHAATFGGLPGSVVTMVGVSSTFGSGTSSTFLGASFCCFGASLCATTAGGGEPVPYLAYSPQLALGRLVDDHLAHNPHAPRLQRVVECDSADAHYEYVHKGLGVAWLPWSMVHADCQARRLARAGDARMEVRFDVRLYRPKRRLGPLAEALWKALAQR